jgi:hypothetical protein
MIRFQCPSCGSTLNAKDSLAGLRRACPKCREAVLIPSPVEETAEIGATQADPGSPASSDAAEAAGESPAVAGLASRPTKLCRHFRYLICDRQRLLALWQNNGQGWQMRVDNGFASASRHGDRLPTEGDFKLIELRLSPDDGHRLTGLRVYQLARRWALRQLPRSDDAILKSIVGPCGLFREHKLIVRQQLETWLMPEIWEDARAVVDYLSGPDGHSPGAGE